MESNRFSIGAKQPYATLQDPAPSPVLGISAPHANQSALDRQTAAKHFILRVTLDVLPGKTYDLNG